jgi:hypothetical protein
MIAEDLGGKGVSPMSTSPRPFRPRLESLEGREVPSALGFFLASMQPALQQQTDVVNADFSRLQADVAAQVSAPATANSQALAMTTANDQAVLQGDFNKLVATNELVNVLGVLGTLQRQLDTGDIPLLAPLLRTTLASNNAVLNLPAQVTVLGDQTLVANPNTTVNQAQASFGFPSPLTLKIVLPFVIR